MAQKQDLTKMIGTKTYGEKPDRDEMEVFSVGAKGLGKSILKHFDKEFDKMVWYVLNNCDDVERYIK